MAGDAVMSCTWSTDEGMNYSDGILTDKGREGLWRYSLLDEEDDRDINSGSAGDMELSGPQEDNVVGVEVEGDVSQYVGPECDGGEDLEWYSCAGNEAAYCQAATESHNASARDSVAGGSEVVPVGTQVSEGGAGEYALDDTPYGERVAKWRDALEVSYPGVSGIFES
eukprot:CAMPEP_0185749292 /NCGR_PEP_ID=MMETSP1174-20130828/8024_1 /TAXON_ID=35687 /ORGANISM="Dictyocha speculum, Strain CCMP1381" /LENGTH=167 /DNA_ID=CAMNT_0028425347 /DNA_START=497 /DNA_END=996 /DNA_ORIENTATION=-